MSELENVYQNVLIEAEEHVKKKSPEIKTSIQLGKGRPAEIIIQIADKENALQLLPQLPWHVPVQVDQKYSQRLF